MLKISWPIKSYLGKGILKHRDNYYIFYLMSTFLALSMHQKHTFYFIVSAYLFYNPHSYIYVKAIFRIKI